MSKIHFHLFVFKKLPRSFAIVAHVGTGVKYSGTIPIVPCPELLIAINQTYNIKLVFYHNYCVLAVFKELCEETYCLI